MKIFNIWNLFVFTCLVLLIRAQEPETTLESQASNENISTEDLQLTSESHSDALNSITVDDDSNLSTVTKDENSDGIITSESSHELEYTSNSSEMLTEEPLVSNSNEETTQEAVLSNSESTSQPNNNNPLTQAVENLVQLTTQPVDNLENSTNNITYSSDNFIVSESTVLFEKATFAVVSNETTESTNSANTFQQDEFMVVTLDGDATTTVESITTVHELSTDSALMSTIDDDNGSGDAEDNVTISFNETSTIAYSLDCQDDQFRCDTNKCLNATQKCDGMVDCDDGTDEACTTTTPETTTTVITTTTTEMPNLLLEMTPNVESIEVREGSQFTIACSVTGKLQDLQAVFYKDQVPLAQSDKGNVELTVENAKLSDEGEYLCYGYPIDRSIYDVKAIKVVILTDKPKPRPKPYKESKLIRVGEKDKTIDLTCDYSNNSLVKWRKVNGELSDYSREFNGILYIYYLKDKDNGEYECYLPDGKSAKVKLNVRDPASSETQIDYEGEDDIYAVKAYVEKSRIELNYGKDEEQICTGMTNGKELEIEWYNPRGQMIQSNQYFRVATELKNDPTLTKVSKLSILNFYPGNAGTYECRAVIGRQKSVAQFEVQLLNAFTTKPTVQSEVCDIQEATCRNHQCIPRSALCNGIRECTDGSDEDGCVGKCEPNEKKCRNGKCIQKIWFCDGENDCGDNSDEDQCPKLIPGEKCHTNEFLCKNGEQCVLKGFVCDSENDCQDNSDEIGCEQPRIVRGPTRNMSVLLGGTIRIECEAAGFPEPYINWRLNWGHVCEEPRCTSESKNGFGVLTIKNAQLSDAGAYSCEALNSKGRLFAIPDAIVRVYDSGRRPDPEELCNIDGSLNRYPPCRCKPNYNGYYCNECGEKYFSSSKSKGCVSCFCNGLNVNCKSSNLYYNSIQSNFMTNSEGWLVSDVTNSLKTSISWNKASIEFNFFSDYDQELYFVAPEKFLGNKLASYGGNLTFTIRYEGPSLSKDKSKKLNVRLSGAGYNLIYNYSGSVFLGYRDYPIAINLNEDNFKQLESNSPVSRDKFLMVLSSLEKILIRASYINNQNAVKLSDVSMSYAEAYSPVSSQIKASAVEVCQCPEGYTGTSCESCAPGYKRIKSGYFHGFCEREYLPNKVTLQIDVPQNKLVMRPGQTHIIYVTVTGGGTAVWYRESDRVLPPGVRQENNNLVIDNARPEISGNYICTVYTPTGELKEIVVIQVRPDGESLREPPSIQASAQRTTKVRLGQPFVLECVANGNPMPTIRIETPDRPATFSFRQPGQSNRAKYEVSYFTSKNIGEYKCIAENEYGEKTVETFFAIQDYETTEPPSIKVEPRVLDVTEGSNIILNFTYSGSEPVDIRIQLYGPGRVPQSNLFVDKRSRKIEIRGVTKEMEGQYILTASNAFGSQDAYFQLRVQEASAPTIFIPETVLRVDEGTQLKIEPRVQYSGQPSFRWTKDNGPLPNNAQMNGYILYIPQVRKENEGVYALNLDDQFGSATIQVRVLVDQKYSTSSRKPNSIRRIHVKESREIELEQGETVYLLCNLKPKVSNPRVFSVTSWFRGGQTQKEKFPSNVRPNQEQLQIIKFKPSNAGAYTCTQVSSDGLSQAIVVNLLLKSEPTQTPPVARLNNKQNNEIKEGDSLDISCSVTGRPEPQIVWLFNNQPINMNNVYPAGSVLSIRGAQLSLNGYVTCRAVSPNGESADDSMYLVVKENKPDLVLAAQVRPQSTSASAGETVRFICNLVDQTTGGEYSNARFTWSKQNGQLSSSNELVLYDLQERDTGAYVCEAQDLITGRVYTSSGSLNVLFEIEKIQPLSVNVTTESTNLLQRRNAELVCHVSGGKNPSISWRKLSSSLDPNRHLVVGNTLVIRDVQLEDRDYFECRVRSEDGQEQTNYIQIYVEPREAPKITIRPSGEELRVSYGGVLYAQCHASGTPAPTIEWRRADGRALSSRVTITQEGSLLQIQEVSEQELGRYECVAKNLEGIASEEINILAEERLESTTSQSDQEEQRQREEEEEEEKQRQRQPPNVIVQKNYVKVVEGQTATLSCSTTSNQQYRIDWLGPSDEFLESNDGTFQLENVRRGQSGTYKCVIFNAFGKNTARIELSVDADSNKSEELRVQITPKSKKVSLGGSVEFKCNANTNKDRDPFVQWSRSGHVQFSAYHTISGNVLRISNVQKEDHGRYQCTVSTSDGRMEFDAAFLQVLEVDNKFPVYIRVLEKPTDLNPPEYQYGVKVTAECVAQSNDVQDISWYKVEGGVNRATYISEGNKNTMRMEALVVMDLGTYVCMATRNDGAKAQNSISFNRSPVHGNRFEIKIEGPSEPVEEPSQEEEEEEEEEDVDYTQEEQTETTPAGLSPPVVKILSQDRLAKQEGESLELKCQASGNPKPDILWNKDNRELIAKYRVVGDTLRVDNLDQSDSGYYVCNAENSEGRERAYVYVEVTNVTSTSRLDLVTTTAGVEPTEPRNQEEKTPLVFIKSRSVASIAPGVETVLSCYVSKTSDIESESNVQFAKLDGSELDSERVNLNKVAGHDFDRFDLIFRPLLETDAGQYKCTAKNIYGSSSDIAYLEKEIDDSFVFRTENFNVKSGSAENVKLIPMGQVADGNILEISCQLQANGEAKYYQWARYENFPKQSSQSNNTLFLNNFGRADNGIYGCKVTTEDNKEYYGSRLIASNDYLLGDNPYFTFSREHNDYVTVRCRPKFNSLIRWETSNKDANYRIDGDDLHLYPTNGAHKYNCVLPSDNEYGSIVLELDANRDLLDKAFEMKLEDNNNNSNNETSDSQSDSNVNCTPGENC